jgi:hypothetical protein
MTFRLLPLLLLVALETPAQSLPAAPVTPKPDAPAARQLTAIDTVQAIHKLFAARRRGGAIMTTSAIGGDLLLAQIFSAADQNSKSYVRLDFGFYALFWGAIAAPAAAIGVHKLIDFSARHKAKAIAGFQQHHTLPRYVNRRLKSFFSINGFYPFILSSGYLLAL